MTTDEIKRVLSESPTVSVPFAGMALANLSRNGSYEAASRGDIETFDVGRLKRVRSAWLRKKLGLDGPAA
jgi:hypothetical protein